MSDYIATVASARSALPVAVQIEELFGDADHFITHFGFDKKPKTWNTEVHFGGRYRLTMQVLVVVDYKKTTVTCVGEPKFWLKEISNVEYSPDGGHSASFNSSHEITFSLSEWHGFYESEGDLTVLGVTKNPKTVPHFEDLVSSIRRDRVHVSLLPNTKPSPRVDHNP